jgi:hypothetical protein
MLIALNPIVETIIFLPDDIKKLVCRLRKQIYHAPDQFHEVYRYQHGLTRQQECRV